MKVKCLIVDDEPIARSILEKYVQKASMLQHIGSLDNALDVMDFLRNNEIDLIFLDINMPEFSGMDLLKSLRNPPAVILTTAYAEYGSESYEFGVVDYLMKPIPFARFLKAIDKVLSHYFISEKEKKNEDHLFLKEDHQVHRVRVGDIIYVQAIGNYCKIFLSGNVIITRERISFLEEKTDNLIRIHKSYLVSKDHVKSIQGNLVHTTSDQILPFGRMYKKSAISALKS